MYCTTEYISSFHDILLVCLLKCFSFFGCFITALFTSGSPGWQVSLWMKGSRQRQKLCKAGRGLNKGLIPYQRNQQEFGSCLQWEVDQRFMPAVPCWVGIIPLKQNI